MSPNDIEEMKLAAATQTEMTELQDRLGSGYIPQGCKSWGRTRSTWKRRI